MPEVRRTKDTIGGGTLIYSVRMELPDDKHTVIERMLFAANIQQAMQLTEGIFGKRVSIVSITVKE